MLKHRHVDIDDLASLRLDRGRGMAATPAAEILLQAAA